MTLHGVISPDHKPSEGNKIEGVTRGVFKQQRSILIRGAQKPAWNCAKPSRAAFSVWSTPRVSRRTPVSYALQICVIPP